MDRSNSTAENDQKVSSTRSYKLLCAVQQHGLISCLPNFNIDYNHEESSAPSNTTCLPLNSSINFNSVDEEDAFLYGDANCIPEEPISAKQKTVIVAQTSKHESVWSDTDSADDICSLKINSSQIENFSKCEAKNKFQENVNFPYNEKQNLNGTKSYQSYGSSKLQTDVSVSGIEKDNFYASSERFHERSHLINKSSKTAVFPGTSDNSEHKSLRSVLKTEESAVRKPITKLRKNYIGNRHYAGKSLKKKYSHEDFLTKHQPMFRPSRVSLVPSKWQWHSRYTVSLPRYKSRDSYPFSRYQNLESEKCYHSRYPENHRQYFPQPKRCSFSTADTNRRSSETTADYGSYVRQICQTPISSNPRYFASKFEKEDYRSSNFDYRHCQRTNKSSYSGTHRSRSTSQEYYTSKGVTSAKKNFNKFTEKTFRRKKHRDNSADSFCSLALSTSSSESCVEEDNKWSRRPNYRW